MLGVQVHTTRTGTHIGKCIKERSGRLYINGSKEGSEIRDLQLLYHSPIFLQQMFFYFCTFNIKKKNSASEKNLPVPRPLPSNLHEGQSAHAAGRVPLLSRRPVGCEARDEGKIVPRAQVLNSWRVKRLEKPSIQPGLARQWGSYSCHHITQNTVADKGN